MCSAWHILASHTYCGFVCGILYVVSLIDSIPTAIKQYRYKMYVNKQIIEMVKEFNDKSE